MATHINLTLQLNTQSFQQALGAAGRQARGLFDQLQHYSQRQQQTGFLGRGDQRAMLQTMQHWERLSQQVRLEQVAVQGQMQQLQAAGPMTQAQAAQFQRLQTFHTTLQARQQAMQTLQAGFPNWQQARSELEHLPLERPGALRGYAAAAGIGLLQRQGGALGQIAGSAATGYAAAGPLGALLGGGVAAIGAAFDKGREAMQAWEQRARGVLAVGQLLDQNFGAITTQVVELSQEFDVLTQESLQGIEAMSRLTGRRPAPEVLRRTVGFGVAYGMTPAQAGTLAGTLEQLGYGASPMARVAAGARNAYGTGALPMRMDVLQEEAVRVSGIGGTVAPPMDPEYYGRLVGFIGGMGARYRLPGAAADFAARLTQGLQAAQDPATLMQRFRALTQLRQRLEAQGRAPTLRIGEGPDAEVVDLRSYEGQRIAMELAGQSPEVQDAYRRLIREEFGFDPELEAREFESMIGGGRLGPTEARRLRRQGFPGALTRRGRATAETEETLAQQREAERRGAVEALPGRLEARWQEMMERIGADIAPKVIQMQLEMIQAGTRLEQAIREQFATLSQAIATHFPTLGSQLQQASTAVTQGAQQMTQAMQQATQLQLGPLGVGPLAQPFAAIPSFLTTLDKIINTFFPAPAAQPGFEYPVLGDPTQPVPTQPQRPSK